jgi:hypothetical protein
MAILPYIEEQQLGDLYTWNPKDSALYIDDYKYDRNGSATHPTQNLKVTQSRITTLTCPSDEPQTNTTFVAGGTYHNYVANYGNTNHVGSSCLGSSCVKYAGSPFITNDSDPTPKLTSFKKITDGLSKTLMFSETVQGHDDDLRGFTWWGFSAGFETTSTPNNDLDYLQNPDYCKYQEPNPPCAGATGGLFASRATARSHHPGGVNVARCDASVQYVVDGVDLATWRAASTAKGNEVYSDLIP